MGGFHGGHSGGGGHGGGGFHGGHSSGGGYHSSSGGGSYHPPVRHAYIHRGKTYYLPTYGYVNGKPISFISSLMVFVAILLIGLAVFFYMYTIPATATVTKTSTAKDSYGDTYEVYDFEYDVWGKTYQGHGDDDAYTDSNGVVRYSVEVGEKYPIYARVIAHSSYKFDDDRSMAVFLLVISLSISGVGILVTVTKRLKFLKDLREIGDVNGDGKLDENDMKYAEKEAEGKAEGAYKAAKENTYDDIKREHNTKYCPFCGVMLNINDRFCSSCGASQSKQQ